jgi:hypothetical protein
MQAMRTRRILWLAAFVAAAVVGFLVLYPGSTPQVIDLPDGSRLKVFRVTQSRHARHCFGNPFQKICAVLPGKMGEKLGGGTILDTGRHTEPVLAIWFTCQNSTNWWSSARIASDDGTTWAATRPLRLGSLGSNQFVGCIIAEAWPRRAKDWNVQVKASGGAWVSFRIPNPNIERGEQWAPESLPVKRQLGGTDISLLAVEVEPWSAQPTDSTVSHMATLYFQVSERGQSTNSWLPSSFSVQDATGNSVACADWNPPTWASSPLFPHNTIAWSRDWPAVPGEKVVKVVADFVRRTSAASYDVSRFRPRWKATAGQPSTNLGPGQVRLEWTVPAEGTMAKTNTNYRTGR